MKFPDGLSESEYLEEIEHIMDKNETVRCVKWMQHMHN